MESQGGGRGSFLSFGVCDGRFWKQAIFQLQEREMILQHRVKANISPYEHEMYLHHLGWSLREWEQGAQAMQLDRPCIATVPFPEH
eukprot:3003363-Amphidinium_carterae.1